MLAWQPTRVCAVSAVCGVLQDESREQDLWVARTVPDACSAYFSMMNGSTYSTQPSPENMGVRIGCFSSETITNTRPSAFAGTSQNGSVRCSVMKIATGVANIFNTATNGRWFFGATVQNCDDGQTDTSVQCAAHVPGQSPITSNEGSRSYTKFTRKSTIRLRCCLKMTSRTDEHTENPEISFISN